MHRRALALSLLILCGSHAAAQRAAPDQDRQQTDVQIQVRTSNDRFLPDSVRVVLMNSTGAIVGEAYTSGNGEARFARIAPGNYRVRISGFNIEPTESGNFTVTRNEIVHSEYVTVPVIPPPGEQAPGGLVTAAEFNIPNDARKHFEKGVKLMEKGDSAGAQKLFEKAVGIYPKYGMAHNNLGVLAVRANDRERGKLSFQKAVEVGSTSGFVNLAKLASIDKDHKQAEELLNKALAAVPTNPEALLLVAHEQMYLGKNDLALANARKVHELPHANYAACHLIAGRMFEEAQQPALALAEYRLFVAEAPQSATVPRVKKAIELLEAHLAKMAQQKP